MCMDPLETMTECLDQAIAESLVTAPAAIVRC